MSPSGPNGPADPITDLDVLAASLAEQFNAYVKAGMPPTAAAVMLGTMLGTMGGHQQHGDDGQ